MLQDPIDDPHEGALERPPSENPTMPDFLCHEKQRTKSVNPLACTSQPRGQVEFMHHTLSKERYESDTPITSDSDVVPR